MVKYFVGGVLPTSSDGDFFTDHPGYPNVTIITKQELDASGYTLDGDVTTADDGWLDIIVYVDVIDLDVARLALADALGIADPDSIVIEPLGVRRAY